MRTVLTAKYPWIGLKFKIKCLLPAVMGRGMGLSSSLPAVERSNPVKYPGLLVILVIKDNI
jgi:hypothetical protein